MHTFTTDNKTISIFPCSESESPVIYLNTFLDEGQKVYEAAQAAGCPPFTLVAISDLDWNHDMVPWDSPAAFKKGEPFTGGAGDYLRLLVEEIIPRAEKELVGPRRGGESPGTLWRGYSPCTPSTRQMCSRGWGACPAPCGFLVSKSTSSPTSRSAGQLHLFLSGGQGGQDTQSGSENSSGEYRGNPGFLPGRGHRHSVPTEFWKPFCPGDRTDRCGHSVAVEQIGDGLWPLFFE